MRRRASPEPQSVYVQFFGNAPGDEGHARRVGTVLIGGVGTAQDPTAAWFEVSSLPATRDPETVYRALRASGFDLARVARVQVIRQGDGPILARQLALVEPSRPVLDPPAPAEAPAPAKRASAPAEEQLNLFGGR